MRSPCATEKQLTITSASSDPNLVYQKEVPLASVDVSSAGITTVPECGVERKKLLLSPNLQSVVGSLLQLSTIRINNIHFDCSDDSYPYLHQGAMHPNLQVMSLSVQFQLCPYDKLLMTVESDLITFFTKPTLKEISLHGYWSMFSDIKTAIVEALHRRADIGIPIHKLMLTTPQTSDARRHSKEELGELWKAIFSLPQLDQTEVVVAGGVCNLTLENEESIYQIWRDTELQRKIKTLKVIRYVGEECIEDHAMLDDMTQTLLFTNKPY